MLSLCVLLLAADLPTATPLPQIRPGTSGRIAKLMAKSDGSSPERAFKVRSMREQYQLLAALGLHRTRQALVLVKERRYDVLTARDASGAERQLWFDISSFF